MYSLIDDAIVALWQKGFSVSEIAYVVGTTIYDVDETLWYYGY